MMLQLKQLLSTAVQCQTFQQSCEAQLLPRIAVINKQGIHWPEKNLLTTAQMFLQFVVQTQNHRTLAAQ